jgi:hypothetical protein
MFSNTASVAPVEVVERNDPVKPLRRRSIVREFCLNTSVHALPGIARSESRHNRMFWTISFICFFGIMVYFIVTSIINYFKYETNIEVNYEIEWPQAFPAVTICNMAKYRLDPFIIDFLNYTNRTGNITQELSNSIIPFLNRAIIANQSLEPYAFSLESMLISCTFNEKPCSVANFTKFFSRNDGLCFTFNAKLKAEFGIDVLNTNTFGGEGQLDLGLYIHTHQIIPYFTYCKYLHETSVQL